MIDLRISEAAALSIVEQADFYAETQDIALVQRWELAIAESIHSLLRFPERGAPCRFRSEKLSGLRWTPVPGFPKHMIFYRYQADDRLLLVVHVLHGARNLEVILDPQT